MPKLPEKVLASRHIYSCRIINVYDNLVKMDNGCIVKREIVEHSGAVAAIALTDKNQIVLVKQFRSPTKEYLLEIPAGLIKKGEKFEIAAKRELKEETGYSAKKAKVILRAYATPGYSNEIITYVLAQNVKFGKATPEEDEVTYPVVMSIANAFKLVKKGKIKDNKTILGLYIAKEIIEK